MKLRKSIILIMGLSVLVLSSFSASAKEVIDLPDDVYYGSALGYDLSTDDKPNVDITRLFFNEVDTTASITMTVKGVIESENTMYQAWYKISDEASYTFTYIGGEVIGIATTGSGGSFDATATADGATLTFEIPSINLGFEGELYGSASTWEEGTDGIGEVWMDFAPVEYAPWYAGGDDMGGDDTGGDDTGGDNSGGNTPAPTGTPGFEALTVLAALGAAFIILRRRK